VETMKIKMKEGRAFRKEFSTNSSNYVINEKAAAVMGMDDPL
jgi:putative ABC transport system permease protein